jgi:hypothetical protein
MLHESGVRSADLDTTLTDMAGPGTGVSTEICWANATVRQLLRGRNDVDGCVAEMTEDTVFESTSPGPNGERCGGSRHCVSSSHASLRQTNPHAKFSFEVFAARDRYVVHWRFDWGALDTFEESTSCGFAMDGSLRRSVT